jgi:hypothetical protein
MIFYILYLCCALALVTKILRKYNDLPNYAIVFFGCFWWILLLIWLFSNDEL